MIIPAIVISAHTVTGLDLDSLIVCEIETGRFYVLGSILDEINLPELEVNEYPECETSTTPNILYASGIYPLYNDEGIVVTNTLSSGLLKSVYVPLASSGFVDSLGSNVELPSGILRYIKVDTTAADNMTAVVTLPNAILRDINVFFSTADSVSGIAVFTHGVLRNIRVDTTYPEHLTAFAQFLSGQLNSIRVIIGDSASPIDDEMIVSPSLISGSIINYDYHVVYADPTAEKLITSVSLISGSITSYDYHITYADPTMEKLTTSASLLSGSITNYEYYNTYSGNTDKLLPIISLISGGITNV